MSEFNKYLHFSSKINNSEKGYCQLASDFVILAPQFVIMNQSINTWHDEMEHNAWFAYQSGSILNCWLLVHIFLLSLRLSLSVDPFFFPSSSHIFFNYFYFLFWHFPFFVSPPAALSDRGTVVLEAAMTSALSALERASTERSRAEAGCRGCVPCLFQDCGLQSGSCCKYNITLLPFSFLSITEPHCL